MPVQIRPRTNPLPETRHQLLFRFIRQDQLAARSWVGVHHELARRRHPSAVAHGPPRIAARRADGHRAHRPVRGAPLW